MTRKGDRNFTTPRDSDLGLRRLTNSAGLSISVLPNGCILELEHQNVGGCTLLNQVLDSPIDGGIARVYLRTGGAAPLITQVLGPGAKIRFGATADRVVWEGETSGVHHRLTLWLASRENIWLPPCVRSWLSKSWPQ